MYKEAREVYAKSQAEADSSKSPDSYIKGKLANMHADIGDTYMDINMQKEAAAEYKKALSLCSNYIDIRTKLGIALREKGDIKGSIEQFKMVKKEKPGYSPAGIGLGLAYYSNKQRKLAAKAWHQVLEADPGNERATMFLRLVEGPRKKVKKVTKKTKAAKKTTKKKKRS